MDDNIPKSVSKKRLHLLNDLVKQNNLLFRKSVKTPLKVLLESKKGEFFEGYDQFFNKIRVKSNKNLANTWCEIENYQVNAECNYAEFK